MIDKFREKRRLVQALTEQKLVGGDTVLAEALAGAVKLVEFPAGQEFVRQDADDDQVYFLLAGIVEVVVKGRALARRHAGEHVGEMALLRPEALRSASIISVEPVVAAWLTEESFTNLAAAHPLLWRRMAVVLADRLRQRAQFVRQPNDTPRLFIGSSVEGLPVARAIEAGLAHDDVLPVVWTDGVFGASSVNIEVLEREVSEADFGVLVFTPDDEVVGRAGAQRAPRDNVIFELGMLMGGLGRKRSYFALPRGLDLKIPTDLLGVTPLTYVHTTGADLAARIAPVCNELRLKLSELGAK